MAKQNGYFLLHVAENHTWMKIIPPKDGGTKVSLKMITSYLDAKSLTDYNIKEISKALNLIDQQDLEFMVGPAPFRPIAESVNLSISLDKMLVFMTAFPGMDGGELLTKQEIYDELKQEKVVTGMLEEVIDDFIANKEYCKEIVICKGIPATQGKDAKIEYFFNRNLNTKPKKNEDGTVDYHSLDTISSVKKGDRLAKLDKEEPGNNGSDVTGNIMKPRDVKSLKLEYGSNISISEDKLELYSEVTGHVSLVGTKVFVSNVYEVPADVDNGIGDINYNGSVYIKGNVKSGFKVVAHGDIVVEGVVEGAELFADGQIIIKRGIHGMTKGVLDAKGNIIAKFIENATVRSGGYIETESIMHSNVGAYSEILVSGKKGFVMGGTIRAGQKVEVRSLGSDMGTMTVVEVGVEPSKKERYSKLRDELTRKQKELDQIKPILVTFTQKINSGEELGKNKVAYVQQLAQQFRQIQELTNSLKEEFACLHQEISMGSDARVKVQNTVYPGVKITISDVSLTTKEERGFCQFIREGGEIVVKNL